MNAMHVSALGAIALALVSWFSVEKVAVTIQDDIRSRSAEALSAPAFEGIRVEADGRDVALLGTVPTGNTGIEAETLVRGLRGVRRVINRLEVLDSMPAVPAKSVPLHLTVSLTESSAVLDGLVPGEATRQSLLELALDRGATEVTDRLEMEPNTHPRWREVLTPLVAAIAPLQEASLRLSDVEVLVSGRAAHRAQREKALSDIRSIIPYGVVFRADVRVPLSAAAQQCQQDFTALLAESRIAFAGSSATLMPVSHPLLDALAGVAGECPEASIEIAGHTDSSGGGNANLRISQERAAAVLRYLRDNGVDASRLSAVGYGETAPIADNDTAEGRDRNRRIELTVKEG